MINNIKQINIFRNKIRRMFKILKKIKKNKEKNINIKNKKYKIRE